VPILNSIAERTEEIAAWRHDIHAHPELLYEVHRTAAKVAQLLGEFGLDEVVTGIGRTGVVGVIRGKNGPGKTIALRAEMDALPILERTGKPHASTIEGQMHACGHDGHTAMLLGATKYLAETRDFPGTVVVVFQPAEEGGAGGQAMIDDGLLERFGIEEVYGMHNYPGLAVGDIATCAGPMMAAVDHFDVTIHGADGHAAWPHLTIDPILVAGHVLVALQSVVARNLDPLGTAVLSVTKISAGTAYNIIPAKATLGGTVRTLTPEARDLMEQRFTLLVQQTAAAYGATATIEYVRGYPATITDPGRTAFVAQVAREVIGAGRVNDAMVPLMGGEDFAFMLQQRPGGYVFIGNGDSSGLHTDTYDFNDEVIPVGVSFWVRLAESATRPNS
jgi:hippurate hydrolase